MTAENMPPVRRVVTGHTAQGATCVVVDALATNGRSSQPQSRSTLIWSTSATPAPMPIGEDVEDAGALRLGSQPQPGGTRFIVMDFLPGATGQMHRTDSIDFIAVLSGEIEMDMEKETIKLKAGDVMVQRGTFHSWVNRGTAAARIAITLVDGEKLGIGRPVEGGRFLPPRKA